MPRPEARFTGRQNSEGLAALAIAALTINFVCVLPAPAQTDKDAQRLAKVKHAVE